MTLLDLSDKPDRPLESIIWLSGVMDQVKKELDEAYAEEYAQARLQGLFETALDVGPFSRRKALALTRRWNNDRGRMIHWNDYRDPTSHRV